MHEVFCGPEAIVAEMKRALPVDSDILIPPPAFAHMGAEFQEYTRGGALRASFPASHAFANPMGVYLGAATGAAIDVLFGALAFLETGAACTTISMESSFIRPIFADGRRYVAEVRVVQRTKRLVFLEGLARNPEGKTAVTAKTTMMILS